MKRLKLGSIKIPEIYVTNKDSEARMLRENGIPFIKWRSSNKSLIKYIMADYLTKILPSIDWYKQYNLNTDTQVFVCDSGGSFGKSFDKEENPIEKTEIHEYLGDISYKVNVEVLQELNLLPTFLMDITDAIRKNLVNTKWTQGYNKKHGMCIGNVSPVKQLRNLIIVDISASIPIGIANTLLLLLDTMKEQLVADVIITGGLSFGWNYEEQLPTPEEMRKMVPRANEGYYFRELLLNKFNNRHYNHVIVFGDDDNPMMEWHQNKHEYRHHGDESTLYGDDYTYKHGGIYADDLKNIHIKVNNLYSYHTRNSSYRSVHTPGYGRWVVKTNPNVKEELDSERWVKTAFIDKED